MRVGSSGASPDEATPRPESAVLAELVQRSSRGHEDAFAELYDRTSSRIHGIVLRVLRSPDQSAEVTQEVFLEVWKLSARYDSSLGSVLAWMVTIAHRRAVDRVRSASSETARDNNYALARTERSTDQVWAGVEHRIDAERVKRGLASLTQIQREAVTLAYFGGYTQSQVAGLLQLPLGTVKTRIRDGIIGLRDALGMESGEMLGMES